TPVKHAGPFVPDPNRHRRASENRPSRGDHARLRFVIVEGLTPPGSRAAVGRPLSGEHWASAATLMPGRALSATIMDQHYLKLVARACVDVRSRRPVDGRWATL